MYSKCRHAHDADRFMDVFLQTAIQHVFEQTWVAVVVLWRHDHQRIGPVHLRRKRRLLDPFAGIRSGQRQLRNVDQFGFNARLFGNFAGHQPRGGETHPTLPGGAEDHREKERPAVFHHFPLTRR